MMMVKQESRTWSNSCLILNNKLIKCIREKEYSELLWKGRGPINIK